MSILKVWDEETQKYVSIPAIKGDKGETGEKGEKGDTGATGLQGEQGPAPIRGTDYWTEEDKAAILQEVLAALPTWTGGSY